MPVEASQGGLESPAFRQLWSAILFTNIAALFFTFSANVIMVNVLHASAFEVGLLDAVTYAGTLLFGFAVGTWIDRWGHKRTLVISTILRGCALTFIPIAYFTGILTPWQIIALGVVVSICDVFFQTAHTSVLPSIVGRDYVSEASARLQSTDQVWRLVGPGAAGQLARVMTVPLMPVLGMISVVAAAVLAALLPPDPPRPPKEVRDGFWHSVRAGLSFVRHHSIIRKLLSASALNNLAVGFYGAVIATFILRELSISAADYGVLMSLGAIGGIVSSLISHRIGKALGPLRTVFIAACMIPVGLGVLPLASYFPSATIAVGASELIFSFAVVLYTVQTTGINARLVPVDLMARVTSARRTVSLGSATLGSLLGAVLTSFTPLTVTLWIAAGLSILQLVPLLRTGAPRRADVQLSPDTSSAR